MKRVNHGGRGFTMVELIIVIVLIGALGGSMMLVFRPALQSYLAVVRRADLSNQADTAVRRLVAEARSAVPNSVRLAAGPTGDQCVEFVPTSDGGRFRTGPDTAWDAVPTRSPSAYIEQGQNVLAFDTVTALSATTVAGDTIVIANQDAEQLYGGESRAVIATIAPSPTDGAMSPGVSRITLTATRSFPPGSDSGRFVIVPAAQGPVTYQCANVNVNGQDTGTGVLYRYRGYGFNATASCNLPAANRQIVATKVARCAFQYDPHPGIVQQSAYLHVQLTLSDAGERANLVYGALVDNVP